MIALTELTPAAEEGWWLLLDLMLERPDTCLLVGGQLIALLAAEHGARLPRATEDVDVVVNVQQHRGGTEWLADWLVARGLAMSKPSADNVGHRFTRATEAGVGSVVFDVLAPSWMGRTVQAPGSTSAFGRSDLVDVVVSGVLGRPAREGRVRRPDLLGALVLKAAGIGEIAVRQNPERDWQDVALLLSLMEDPLREGERCTARDRRRLRVVLPLADREHVGWSTLTDADHRRGRSALGFLLPEG